MFPERTLINASHLIAYDGKQHRHLRDGVIVYEGDTIIHVGKKFDGQVDHVIDATGKVVTPGFIDTHMHMYESPLDRSLVEDTGPRNFYGSGLFEMLPARSAAEDEEGALASIEFSMAELIRGGTTCAVELGSHYDYTADQAARFGLRVYVGMAYRSARWFTPDGKAVQWEWQEEQGIADMNAGMQWLEKNDGSRGGLVKALLAPRQVDTCSEALLRRTREVADHLRVPVTLHTAQSVVEFQEMIRRHGKTPIEWLRDIGFLAPNVILGHAVIIAGHSWANYAGDDLSIMAQSGCTVAHSPWVFVRRGVTLESFARYLKAGINLSLGTDTAPQSMLEAMRYASIFSKVVERRSLGIATAADVFNAATLGGAKALGRDDLGRIAKGAKADLVIWETESLSMSPLRDPIRNLVFNAQNEDAQTVIINGKIVLQDRVLTNGVNVKELARRVQAAGERMWPNLHKGHWAHHTVDELSPQSFAVWDGE
jgi:cytosine/adenosine deaminase-related metal-dependent hydrolase